MIRAPAAPLCSVIWRVIGSTPPSFRSSVAGAPCDARSGVVFASRGDLRVETGERITSVDQVALVDQPLGEYPVVAGGDVDLLAAAADRAQRRAGRQVGALGDVGRADRAADGGDDHPPVGEVLRLGPPALGLDELAGAVEVLRAGQ